MNVFHICSDYPFTPIYRQLLEHFDTNCDSHTMYVPLSTGHLPEKKTEFTDNGCKVLYSPDFSSWERLFYHRKRQRIFRAVRKNTDVLSSQLIHAHYLFSAGGVALTIKNEFDIRYVVSIRNTDLNTFFRRAPHLRRYGIKILSNAEKIFFLSPAYRDKLFSKYVPKSIRQQLMKKSSVVPSGIKHTWHEQSFARSIDSFPSTRDLRLLFVGELSKNKNVEACIGALHILSSRDYRVSLTIIGDGKRREILQKQCIDDSRISMIPRIDNVQNLIEEFRKCHVFVMPSFTETFGLVYLEAMSQGLPVVYSIGEGIDGYWQQGRVGFAVSPHNHVEIADRIEQIVANFGDMSSRCTIESKGFDWPLISKNLQVAYSSAAAGA